MRAFPAHGSSNPLASSGLLLVGECLLVTKEVQELLIVLVSRPTQTCGFDAMDMKVLVVVQALAASWTEAFLPFRQIGLPAAEIGMSPFDPINPVPIERGIVRGVAPFDNHVAFDGRPTELKQWRFAAECIPKHPRAA